MAKSFKADDDVVRWLAAMIKKAGGSVTLTDIDIKSVSPNDVISTTYNNALREYQFTLTENVHPLERQTGPRERHIGSGKSEGAKKEEDGKR